LEIIHNYKVSKANDELGRWKISTLGYIYTIQEEGEEIIGYHWHPQKSPMKYPHFHLHKGTKAAHKVMANAHLPTGRIAIEDLGV
jgi:hypothetical protein